MVFCMVAIIINWLGIMKSTFQYKETIRGRNIDTIVKDKCQYICQKVKNSKQKNRIHDYPSVVVGCHAKCHPILHIDTTNSRKDYTQTPTLHKALLAIGEIGKMRYKNRIGLCAEPKTAYDVISDVHCNLRCLRFSKAIRPRTMQVIPYCRNCKDVFGI